MRKLLGSERYAPEIGQLLLQMAGSIQTYGIYRPKETDTVEDVVNLISSLPIKIT